MCTTEIKRVENDESVTNSSTATFEVVFNRLESLQLYNSKSIPHSSSTRSANSPNLYEVTKHGCTTYSVIGNKISPIDSMPMRFVASPSSEGCKVTRIVSGFDNVDIEYTVGRKPNTPSFLNASLTEIDPLSSKTSQQYEDEAIEAFKVGIFVNELVQIGSWEAISMQGDDDLGDWVEIEGLKGHAMEACNGWSLVESAKRGV